MEAWTPIAAGPRVAGGTRAGEAYVEIKRRIIELEMPPGAPFTEGELASELGISKTPAREALARLQVAGLVEVVPRSGYRVTAVTVKSTRDLFGLRSLLEPEAAALAASGALDLSTLATLEALGTMTYRPEDRASVRSFLRANNAFHVSLARVGGNEQLARLLEQILEQLERPFYLGLTLSPRADEIVHEHTELLNAVKRGDADGARSVAAAQAAASQKMVIDALLSSDAVVSANVATGQTLPGQNAR